MDRGADVPVVDLDPNHPVQITPCGDIQIERKLSEQLTYDLTGVNGIAKLKSSSIFI